MRSLFREHFDGDLLGTVDHWGLRRRTRFANLGLGAMDAATEAAKSLLNSILSWFFACYSICAPRGSGDDVCILDWRFSVL